MKPDQNDPQSFELSAAVREILSWRLMAELIRRHPNVGTLIETHPGGGQYDCLTLYREAKSIASLNRGGSFTPFFNPEARIDFDQIWLPCLKDQGIARVLNQFSQALGLEVPKKLPHTTSEVLVYRLIAGILAFSLLDKDPLVCRNGQMDSSGSEDQVHRETWFEAFPTAQNLRCHLDRSASPCGNPNYRFWFILRRNAPVLGFSTDGNAHTKEGVLINLMEIYKRRRKLEDVTGAVIAHCV